MTSQEIRRSFLDYFARHGHRVVASSPLVPHDDPTLLFTNAGMNQFKDVFLGREKRDYTRAATSQKIMRVSGKHNDLDNVGPSHRHHTFFEMLGNFSFGDYFKAEALPFAWELLTGVWKLDPNKMIVSIFKGENGIPRDAEAYDIWRTLGVPADRILELGEDDNFWSMGETGPCGRCSEIYYVRGGSGHDPEIEIWNNVFMEFERSADGTLTPLPTRCIDTGMGLERVTAVLQGKQSNYDTDLFTPLLARIGEMRGLKYGDDETHDISMRVVADHTRAMTFLIGDGVVPSNEWRGYVLRKIMRRAMRHGKHLGIREPFLFSLVDTMVAEFGGAYPELIANRDTIARVIRSEEERFDAVLTDGLPRLEDVLDQAAAAGGVVPGDAAFKLYDTFGIPRDFIEDMIEARKLRLDVEGFDAAMNAQRTKARAQSAFKGGAAKDAAWTASDATRAVLDETGEAVFRGYDRTSLNTQILALFDDARAEVPSLTAGQSGFAVLRETPFYLEAGGQVSDVGTISAPGGAARVTGVVRAGQWPRAHAVEVAHGTLAARDLVTADVTAETRDATRRNHTATHLLHAALRQVLGGHVKQAGSLVAPDRLRFDFAHFSAVTREQWLEIEAIVNARILENTIVTTEVKDTEAAIAAGAMALFGEKYGDKVRVVSVPGFSTELCGGTHVRATGDIGLFAIVSESGVAAGVRRIEATTGAQSLRDFQAARETLGTLSGTLNAAPAQLAQRVAALQDEVKRVGRELQQAKTKAAFAGGSGGGAGGDATESVQVAGVTLVARQVEGLDKDGLRALVDRHRDQIKSGVVVLASPADGKVLIVAGVTPDLVKKIPAGQIVKQLAPIVGGGGGGRPDFAEAGGKDPSKIGELLAASRAVVEKLATA
ncbi:MAG TPA: alanine--tRNA ligase [Vicinamibacterales bacterium]|jgi:alanyl-tRNA synthetase|nr:alanine--tRNA ligase [Vicinamibacterales bacterium]